LVFRYENRIYRFVSQFCPSSADVAEVTQDTFVKAFRALARFDPRRSFSAWLFTIARHECINHHRAKPRVAENDVLEAPVSPDPSEELALREDRHNLWRLAQRRLPGPQFQALWLRYVEDLSVAEIAQVLRKTQPHVKILLFRARNTLAQVLVSNQTADGQSLRRESGSPGTVDVSRFTFRVPSP
jgi:RNA polymerase sigma-70 factor (ECF subfamily)